MEVEMGGPRKGSRQSPEHIAKRIAARRANGTLGGWKVEDTSRYSDAVKKKWETGVYADRPKFEHHTEETRAKMSETRKQMWADGRYENAKPATRRRVSRMELSLKPYLERLGYRHNTGEEIESFIACPDRTRLPDFIDIEGRRVFEFFGNFWHKPEDEAVWTENYAAKDWACTILWEKDLYKWLEEHKHLVSEEEHAQAIRACRVRTKL
jgi:hypothetical protein